MTVVNEIFVISNKKQIKFIAKLMLDQVRVLGPFSIEIEFAHPDETLEEFENRKKAKK